MMEGGGTRGRTNQKLFGNGEVNAPRSHPYNIISGGCYIASSGIVE